MAELVLSNVTESVFSELQRRAAAHRRTPADEAQSILAEVLADQHQSGWNGVEAIYAKLSAAGGSFSDSASLLREDRDR